MTDNTVLSSASADVHSQVLRCPSVAPFNRSDHNGRKRARHGRNFQHCSDTLSALRHSSLTPRHPSFFNSSSPFNLQVSAGVRSTWLPANPVRPTQSPMPHLTWCEASARLEVQDFSLHLVYSFSFNTHCVRVMWWCRCSFPPHESVSSLVVSHPKEKGVVSAGVLVYVQAVSAPRF